MSNPNPSPDTRFGARRGNPVNRSTGAWKKSETARFQFEMIQNLSIKKLEAMLSDKDKLTVLQYNAARATMNLVCKKDISVEDLSRLIDVYESKPAQHVEVSDLPTPKPFDELPGSDHPIEAPDGDK